jgi:hypothetical protein
VLQVLPGDKHQIPPNPTIGKGQLTVMLTIANSEEECNIAYNIGHDMTD